MNKIRKNLSYCKTRLLTILNVPKYMGMLNKSHESGELAYLSDEEFGHWKKMFKKMLLNTYIMNTELIPVFFASAKIEERHIGKKPRKDSDITALLVVKDVFVRMKLFLQHGREIGVDRFVILDNGCGEEILKWLAQQDDVDLYHTDDKFQTLAKDGWINRLISIYGRNKWYLQLDSDELPAFFGMSEHSLHDVVNKLEANGYTRARAVLLDMYSKEGLFRHCNTPEDIKREFVYFDTDSFVDEPHMGMRVKKGGPRYRMFEDKQMLSKCPLYKFGDDEIVIDAHFQWPYSEVERSPYVFALLHYKYIFEDLKEYMSRAKKGNFSAGSRAYKAFAEAYNNNSLDTFYYDGSCRYRNEHDLTKLGFIENLF